MTITINKEYEDNTIELGPDDVEKVTNDDDFVFYKNKKNGEFIGGGYMVNSILLKSGISPMITLNKKDKETGEITNMKLSDVYSNLAVPSGLFYKYSTTPDSNKQFGGSGNIVEYGDSGVIDDDIYEKLLDSVTVKDNKKKKTKKNLKSGKTMKNGKKYRKTKKRN